MRAFLIRWFGWLAVPHAPAAAALDEQGPIPPGLYVFAPGEKVTGHEPLSFFLAHRRGDSDRVETMVAVHP